MYYIISQSGGDVDIYSYTLDGIQQEMDEWFENEDLPVFMTNEDIINSPDPMYWPEYSKVIIKGKVVVPKPEEKITKMKIE